MNMSRGSNGGSDIQPQDGSSATSEAKDLSFADPVNSPAVLDCHVSGQSEKCVPAASVAPPFSVYTRRHKWLIIIVASFAGLFSPLTANIYFPAIQTLASAFHTSVELINVTVTVYMVLQGVSPMLWGTLSDRLGRRPLFLVCLALLSISCVGLALVPTNAYWLLVLLRCFQAAGSASTIALGAGTISDIAEPWERGGFLGAFGLGPLVGPCIGPIIGGLLTAHLGWRSIFWFLAITCGVYLVFFFMVFPETLRVLVGNGGITPSRWNRPPLPILTKYDVTSTTSRPPPKKFINPLLQFTHPSVVLVLFYNGTLYSVLYSVSVPLSNLFTEAYPFLSESQLGLCFLAIGVGCGLGSFVNGKMLDADFRRIQKRLDKKAAAVDLEKDAQTKDLTGKDRGAVVRQAGKLDDAFPIEYARLRLIPAYVAVLAACLIGYGWAIRSRVHMACPLILQFLIGYTVVSVMNTSQTLLLDLYATQGSSITAAVNLVRCTMGAVLVSIINFILSALHPGWTYTLMALICVLFLPINWVVIKFGPRWRARRKQMA